MEFAREGAKTDIVLHKIAQRAQTLNKILDVEDYTVLVPEDKSN
jgi:hypothetical protein